MSIIITLTGVRLTDAISPRLSTSLTAYAAASTNTYVEITEEEFTELETISGAQGFGLKRTSTRWSNRSDIGSTGYTNNKFLPNQDLVGMVPYAFMTKLAVGTSQRVQITKQLNVVGQLAQVPWVADSKLVNPATTAERHKFFVLKSPTNTLEANTNLAVDGFNNGWGANSGDIGIENASTGTPSSSSVNDTNASAIVPAATVTVKSTGAPSATQWTNYRILLAPKQW